MTEQPLVTVIAVCFNHARFVTQCLDSILNQTYDNVQIIIMDDCSQDESVRIIQDWIERYGITCRFIIHAQNQGLCRTLNEALSHALGKYISMVATDDVWMPEKLFNQVSAMEGLPEQVGVIYSDAYQIDEKGDPLPNMFIEEHRLFDGVPEGEIFSLLLEANFVPAMSTLIRASVYARVGNYDERLIYEDWDMWLRISRQFHFAYSAYVSARYRVVANSLTRRVLRARGNARFTSDFTIFEKVLAFDRLTNQQQALLHTRLSYCARALYIGGHFEAKSYLWKALSYSMDRASVLSLLLALLGVQHSKFRRLHSYLNWRWCLIRGLFRKASWK